jgi:hypothetical protein
MNPDTPNLRVLAGERVLVIGDDVPIIRDASGGRDLIEAALNERATVVAVPVERLDASFFELRSGLAGEILQKCVNYHLKIAIVGDVSDYVAASGALRDFVVECERGRDVFFVADLPALDERLTAPAS